MFSYFAEYSVVSSIPEPVIAPVPVPLAQIDNLPIVYFDLETTGLGEYLHDRKPKANN